MSKLQKIYINEVGDENAVIYVRCDEKLTRNMEDNGLNRVSAGKTVEQTAITLKNEMNKIKDVLKCVYESMNESSFKPDELEVSAGLELSSSVGAVLVSGDINASIAIKAVWKKD